MFRVLLGSIYLVGNIFGLGLIPDTIWYDGVEWFSAVTLDGGKWQVSYCSYNDGFKCIVKATSKFRYVAFWKMLYELYRLRKEIRLVNI